MAIKVWKEEDPRGVDEDSLAAWTVLRCMKHLGGTVGMRAHLARWRWVEGSEASLGEDAVAQIPRSWAQGLREGPEGEAGRALALALVRGDLARRQLDHELREQALAAREDSDDLMDYESLLFKEFSKKFASFTLREIVEGVSVAQEEQARQATPAQWAKALEDVLERAQTAWDEHRRWKVAMERFKAQESLLDAQALEIKRDAAMERAWRMFWRWDQKGQRSEAGLAVGRSLALAAFGIEEALDPPRSGDPRWRGARKLMALSNAQFGLSPFYGESPNNPLEIGGASSGVGSHFVWHLNDGKTRSQWFHHPLLAAREVSREPRLTGKSAFEPVLDLPEGGQFRGQAAWDWAQATLAGFERAILEEAAPENATKAAPKRM